MAIANSTQLESVTLLARTLAIVVPLPALTLKAAANPNDSMVSAISDTRSALRTILRMISCILGPILICRPSQVGQVQVGLNTLDFKSIDSYCNRFLYEVHGNHETPVAPDG